MLCALALLMIGVVMVQSAGMQVPGLGETTLADSMGDSALSGAAGRTEQVVEGVTARSLLTSRSALYLLMAVVAMVIASRVPMRKIAGRLDRVVWFKPGGDLGVLIVGSLFLIAMVLTVYVPGLERPRNGAHRWVNLRLPGLESMQPSELAKWGLVILVAWYAARLSSYRENRLAVFCKGLLPAVLCVGAVAFAVVMEDLGTGVLMVLGCSVVLLAGGARVKHFAAFVPIGLAGDRGGDYYIALSREADYGVYGSVCRRAGGGVPDDSVADDDCGGRVLWARSWQWAAEVWVSA